MDDPSEKPWVPYRGVTVNERLLAANLIDAWDTAAARRNRAEMIRLLESVDLTRINAETITDTILVNPKMYGF